MGRGYTYITIQTGDSCKINTDSTGFFLGGGQISVLGWNSMSDLTEMRTRNSRDVDIAFGVIISNTR